MVWNIMYAKLRSNPIPSEIPIPFLRFLAESDSPMAVRMKAVELAKEAAEVCRQLGGPVRQFTRLLGDYVVPELCFGNDKAVPFQ